MRAFVEWAGFVSQRSRNDAPQTGEVLKIHEILEPAHDQIARVLPFRKVLDRRQIGQR